MTKLVELESKRFQNIKEAKDYVDQFSIEDMTVEKGKMEYADGAVRMRGQELPFTKQAWGQF